MYTKAYWKQLVYALKTALQIPNHLIIPQRFIKLTAVYWLYLLCFMPSGNKCLIVTGQVLSQLKQLTDGITSMYQDVNVLKCISSLQHNSLGTPGIVEVDSTPYRLPPTDYVYSCVNIYKNISKSNYYKNDYYKITVKYCVDNVIQ